MKIEMLLKSCNFEEVTQQHRDAADLDSKEKIERTVKEFFEKSPDAINLRDSSNQTFLHWAAKDNPPIVQILLDHHAEIDPQNNDLQTPLFIAVTARSLTAAKLLLSRGATPNLKNRLQSSPLHLAEKNMDMMILLIRQGAIVDIKDEKFKKILTSDQFLLAIENELAKSDPGSDSFLSGALLLGYMARGRASKIKELLTTKTVDANIKDAQGMSPLWWILELGDLGKSVQMLLDHGADASFKDVNGWSLLHRAVEKGYWSVTKELLQHEKSKLSANEAGVHGVTPLEMAAYRPDERIVKMLINKGGDRDVRDLQGATLLHMASQNGHYLTAEMLIENYMQDPQKLVDTKGRTALHYVAIGPVKNHSPRGTAEACDDYPTAIAVNETERIGSNLYSGSNHETPSLIIEVLLKAGIAMEIKDHEGYSPLLLAAHYGSWVEFSELVDHHASLNARKNDGATLIHILVEQKRLSFLYKLKTKARSRNLYDCITDAFNTKDNAGNKPFHKAIQAESIELLDFVLEHSLQLTLEDLQHDQSGAKAISMIRSSNNPAGLFKLLDKLIVSPEAKMEYARLSQ
jgi:ankyrin repeat protein